MTFEQRARTLVSQMTLAEKISQMRQEQNTMNTRNLGIPKFIRD